jgi:hypothetical protein
VGNPDGLRSSGVLVYGLQESRNWREERGHSGSLRWLETVQFGDGSADVAPPTAEIGLRERVQPRLSSHRDGVLMHSLVGRERSQDQKEWSPLKNIVFPFADVVVYVAILNQLSYRIGDIATDRLARRLYGLSRGESLVLLC